MITNYWIEKGISALLLCIVVVLGYFSFGYPVYFDQLTLCVLVFSLLLFKVEQNLASIALILLSIRALNELLFAYQGPYQDIIFYCISFAVVFKFKFDRQIPTLLLPVLVLCCLAHVYWYITDYDAPNLGIYVFSIAMNCIVRYLLMFRVHLTSEFKSVQLFGITLDYDLYRLTGVSSILVFLMIFEYLIRHLTPLNPMLIYEIYSYVMQVILLLIPYFFVSYFIRSRFRLYA